MPTEAGTTLRLCLAQVDFRVGAIADNAARIRAVLVDAAQRDIDLVIFPDRALNGGPLAEAAALRDQPAVDAALRALAADAPCAAVIGHYACADGSAEPVLRVIGGDHAAGDATIELRGLKIAVARAGMLDAQGFAPAPDAALLIVLDADAWTTARAAARVPRLARLAAHHSIPIAWLNAVGAHDEFVFDGASLLLDAHGNVLAHAPAFIDAMLDVELAPGAPPRAVGWPAAGDDALGALYAALCRALRDYVAANRFPGVVLGLSGGMDSALVLQLAVDALGADRVEALMLPSRHTSELSHGLAHAQATRLGVAYRVMPIGALQESLLETLAPVFAGTKAGVAEENLQARTRGVLLMAISNKRGSLLLATGNKSESAVGYSTLYGDMCGGFAPLGDVYKTRVYRLAKWRNAVDEGAWRRLLGADATEFVAAPIPADVISRAPSAELRDDQTDQDTLPPYEVLDAVLERLIEGGATPCEVIAAGFEPDLVMRIAGMLWRAEFKRRQAAPGAKVTDRAFGVEWRWPLSSG